MRFLVIHPTFTRWCQGFLTGNSGGWRGCHEGVSFGAEQAVLQSREG